MKIGKVVNHKTFGKGVIVDIVERKDLEVIGYENGKATIVENGEMLDPAIVVKFESVGEKRFTEKSLNEHLE